MLVCEMVELRRVVDVRAVSSGGHPAPNDMPCMSICLDFTKFHASHHVVWNVDIVGHEDVRVLAMRIKLFLSWKCLVQL